MTLLRNLGAFLQEPSGLDPLIKMAVAHYQFEAIHPFVDGNGRTGRILNLIFLIQSGLLEIPVLYLSRYIIQNKGEYYRRLRAVTEGSDWEGWLIFMLTAVEGPRSGRPAASGPSASVRRDDGAVPASCPAGSTQRS